MFPWEHAAYKILAPDHLDNGGGLIDFWQNTLAEVERQIRVVIDLHSIDYEGRAAIHADVICRVAGLILDGDVLTSQMNQRADAIERLLSKYNRRKSCQTNRT